MRIEDAATDYGLTLAPAAVLCRLAVSAGRFVSMQDLRDALEERLGGRTTEEAVRTAIKRARRGLGSAGRIEARSGIGYRLTWL